jgi:hypothetical protein
VTPDYRPPVPAADRDRLIAALDAELRRRLPAPGRLLLGPDVLDVALPLSGRATAAGLGVLPRGSVSAVDGEQLRSVQRATATSWRFSCRQIFRAP